MKPATNVLAGRVVELERLADLLDDAVAHHDDPVGHRHRLDLVVRHVDRRRLEALVQLLDLGAHLHAQLRVEVRQRLVEQEHLRVAHDRAPHRDALALAARELARIAVEVRREPEDVGGASRRAAAMSSFAALREHQRERHVVAHRHVRIERVVLEHHRDVALLGRHALTTLPPIAISPSVISSSPAIMRSSVDLPQPDGPTSTQNSPSAIVDVDAADHLRRAEPLVDGGDVHRGHLTPPRPCDLLRAMPGLVHRVVGHGFLVPLHDRIVRPAGAAPRHEVLRGLAPQFPLRLDRIERRVRRQDDTRIGRAASNRAAPAPRAARPARRPAVFQHRAPRANGRCRRRRRATC